MMGVSNPNHDADRTAFIAFGDKILVSDGSLFFLNAYIYFFFCPRNVLYN